MHLELIALCLVSYLRDGHHKEHVLSLKPLVLVK